MKAEIIALTTTSRSPSRSHPRESHCLLHEFLTSSFRRLIPTRHLIFLTNHQTPLLVTFFFWSAQIKYVWGGACEVPTRPAHQITFSSFCRWSYFDPMTSSRRMKQDDNNLQRRRKRKSFNPISRGIKKMPPQTKLSGSILCSFSHQSTSEKRPSSLLLFLFSCQIFLWHHSANSREKNAIMSSLLRPESNFFLAD